MWIDHPENFMNIFRQLAKTLFTLLQRASLVRQGTRPLVHQQNELSFVGAQLPHSQPERNHKNTGADKGAYKGETICLVEMRLQGNRRRRTGLIPDAFVAARNHPEFVFTRWYVRVVRYSSRSRIHPVFVKALQHVFEAYFLRRRKAQRSKMKLHFSFSRG